METVKAVWNRIKSYGAYGLMFIFISPTFRWENSVLSVTELDSMVTVRYLVDVFVCWALVELVAMFKRTDKKVKRKYNKRYGHTNQQHRQI